MNTPNLFRKIRAICRTMQKTRWFLLNDECIRTCTDGRCPIAFVLKAEFGLNVANEDVTSYGHRLFLFSPEVFDIMGGADNSQRFLVLHEKSRKLRRIFLKTTKLKESCAN